MSLYEDLIALVNKYFYKTEEKPAKYNEWLQNGYSNGTWYLCEDFIYFNDGSDTNLHNPQGATITTNNGYLTITTNTDGEKKVNFPTEWFDKDANVYMEMTYCGGSVQPIGICFNNTSNSTYGWVSYDPSTSRFSNALSGSGTNVTGIIIKIGDVFRLERDNDVSKFYQNGELLFSFTRFFPDTFRFGFYTNNSRVQSWKNIKIGYVTRVFEIKSNHLYMKDEYKDYYKIENGHLYVDTNDITQYKIENKHLYKEQ